MKIDIRSMVVEFGDTLDIYTISQGSYINGYYQPGDMTKSSIIAAVFPLKPHELKMMPEGARLEGGIKFYSKNRYPVSNYNETPVNATNAVYRSEKYRVIARKNWRDYYCYYAELVRIDDELPT